MRGIIQDALELALEHVAGHGFNLAINALGAYVHSCRLQYIEFYSKFFEGNGRAFVPYGYRTKYIQLKSEA